MNRHLFYIICILAECLFALDGFAQRTSEGTFFVGIEQMASVSSVPSGGLAASCGSYLRNSYWKAGISVVDYMQKTSLPDKTAGPVFDHMHFRAEGGWLYRLCSTYSRNISLYLGGSAYIGMQSYYIFRKLPSEVSTSGGRSEFIYGIQPEILSEFFVSKKVALTLGIQGPFTFGSSLSTDLWHLTASLGVRVNL